jgi:signal recognition particle subunit SRP54
MGDIVSLVEKAAETIDRDKAMAIAEKMRKGRFDLDDLRDQLIQMTKLGGMGGIMGMIPGIAKMKNQIANAGIDDRMLKRQVAIIDSMTPHERANPDILKASRKRRIATGSGTSPEHINRLLKMHRQMADVMKTMSRGKGGMMGKMAQMFGIGGGGGDPLAGLDLSKLTPQQLETVKQQLGGQLPPDFPGMPAGQAGIPGARPASLPPNPFGSGKPVLPGLGSKLPGLGGGFPGLPGGFNPFGGKKK